MLDNNLIISETLNNPVMLGLFIGIIVFSLIIIVVLFISTIKLLKLVNKSIAISLLLLIPFGHIIITLIINPTKSLNKSTGYLIGLIFLPFIFLPLLAFSDNNLMETSKDNKSLNPMDIINGNSTNSTEIVEISNTIQPIQMATISTNQISIDDNNQMQNKETLNIQNNNNVINPIASEVVNSQNYVNSISEKTIDNETIHAQNDIVNMSIKIEDTNQNSLMPEQPTINSVSQSFSNLEEPIQLQNNIPVGNISNPVNMVDSYNNLTQSINTNQNIAESTIEMPIQSNSVKTCKSCGTEIPNSVSVCSNCGTEN